MKNLLNKRTFEQFGENVVHALIVLVFAGFEEWPRVASAAFCEKKTSWVLIFQNFFTIFLLFFLLFSCTFEHIWESVVYPGILLGQTFVKSCMGPDFQDFPACLAFFLAFLALFSFCSSIFQFFLVFYRFACVFFRLEKQQRASVAFCKKLLWSCQCCCINGKSGRRHNWKLTKEMYKRFFKPG